MNFMINIQKKMNKLFWMPFTAMLFLFVSCEDEPPTIYIQEYYVEAYLFVGERPSGIKVFKTIPITSKFNYEDAIIKDADVKLFDKEGNEYQLEYRDGEDPGYFSSDPNLIIKKLSTYRLEVTTTDNKFMWGETNTPDMTAWIMPPKNVFYYPTEEGDLPTVDSLRIKWKNAEMNQDDWLKGAKGDSTNIYLLYTICHDTLEYGKYLDPPTTDTNRRIKTFFSDREDTGDFYNNVTFTTIIAYTETPTVWLAFKWFGLHSIDILVPDYNMLQWFIQTNWKHGQYEPLLSSIEGEGIGVFGSAYRISKECLLKKPVEE